MVIPLGPCRRGAILAVVGALLESDYIHSVGLKVKFNIDTKTKTDIVCDAINDLQRQNSTEMSPIITEFQSIQVVKTSCR